MVDVDIKETLSKILEAITSMKETITSMKSMLSTPFKLVEYSAQYYSNGRYMDFVLPVHNGYTPIAVVGYRAGGSTDAGTQLFECDIMGNNTYLRISCASSGSISAMSLSCRILYVKSEFLEEGGY